MRQLHRATHALGDVDEGAVGEDRAVQAGKIIVALRDDAAEIFAHQLGMLVHCLADGHENDAGLLQLLAKGGRDRDAVEHRVDRDFPRALDAGEHLLLLDRDSELFIDSQDLGIDLVEAAELGLLLRLSVIISVLIIDLGQIELGPVDLFHLEPRAIALEAPVEHPPGLVLLRRDEADRVFIEALGRELLLDVAGEAPFVILGDLLADLAVLDGLVHRASSIRLTAPSAPRTACPTRPKWGLTRQRESSAQS